MRRVIAALIAITALAAAPVLQAQPAAKAGSIELKNIAETDVTQVSPDGKKTVKRVPVDQAVPGTEVIYTSTFRNIGNAPAGDIVINNPIPENTLLIGGSAFGENCVITFSADGGKTFAAADRLRVRDPDGKERPAALSEFTHIRWVYRGALPPGASSSVGFRVTVR